jgi:hypothetical protein
MRKTSVYGDSRTLGVYTRAERNEKLHNLYPSPYIIRMIKSRRMRWARHVASMWDTVNAYRILARKPEGKRPHRRPKHKLENNIKNVS